jgi:hypothetical protein
VRRTWPKCARAGGAGPGAPPSTGVQSAMAPIETRVRKQRAAAMQRARGGGSLKMHSEVQNNGIVRGYHNLSDLQPTLRGSRAFFLGKKNDRFLTREVAPHESISGIDELTKDSVRPKPGFAHTNEYPSSVQSGRTNDTAPIPVSRQKGRRLRHRGETSSLSTAHAETPRHRDRPGEYTPHVRLYPAHTYPHQKVTTALQARIRVSGDVCGFFLA